MGYDVYITRALDWLDREEYPIPESEWLTVLAANANLEHRAVSEHMQDKTHITLCPLSTQFFATTSPKHRDNVAAKLSASIFLLPMT